MNSKRKQKIDKKRQESNHSVTKTLQKSENRQLGKAGKILTVDFTGRPAFGRIEKTRGAFRNITSNRNCSRVQAMQKLRTVFRTHGSHQLRHAGQHVH